MNLQQIPDWLLKRYIAQTENSACPDHVALAILRREQSRREASQAPEQLGGGPPAKYIKKARLPPGPETGVVQ